MTGLETRRPTVPADVHDAACQVLVHEAMLLDQRRFDEWLTLLTGDMTYRIPVRVTGEVRDGSDIADDSSYFEEDAQTLAVRLSRFGTNSAWAEDPPSRTRHFVSNVRVEPGSRADELLVTSYLMFTRCRGSSPDVYILTGAREDVWRVDEGEWRLARRRVYFDQSVLGTLNLSTIY